MKCAGTVSVVTSTARMLNRAPTRLQRTHICRRCVTPGLTFSLGAAIGSADYCRR